MGQHDGQAREVGGDVVEQHRVGVAQLDPPPAGQAGADPGLPGVEQRRDAELLQGRVERVEALGVGLERLQAGVELDRKSTRLNSSHANISYAVFCLKKKKVRQPLLILNIQV